MDEVTERGVGEIRGRLQSLVQRGKTPGLQYLVVAPDRVVFDFAAGWADIAGRHEMTSDTTLMAYSMSKTITAAAVLVLADTGALGLDDPIERYLDHPYGAGISIRHLLTHTSGLPNPIPLRWVHPAVRHDGFDERTALAAILGKYPKLSSTPGARYRYSNIGYWLLGPIVERASGQPFAAFVNERIIGPLGVAAADLGYSVHDAASHAHGYLEKYSFFNLMKGLLIDRGHIGGYEGPWLHIRDHFVNGAAFGGLVGTARGFGRFLQDQLGAHSVLFGNRTRDMFYAADRTNDGKTVAMTPGWHVGALGGAPFFFKEGGGGGFHCMMRLYPEARIATVVMANATGFDVRSVLDSCDPHVGAGSGSRR